MHQPTVYQPESQEKGIRQPGNLKLGELGVIGYNGGSGPKDYRAYHSIVGQGEGNDGCIQIMWMHGHMGIVPYTNILDFFRQRVSQRYEDPTEIPDLGVYSLGEAGMQALSE